MRCPANRRRAVRALAIAGALSALVPATSQAATPITIAAGHKPGVAVDPAGTAHLAWNGPETTISVAAGLPPAARGGHVRPPWHPPGPRTSLCGPSSSSAEATVADRLASLSAFPVPASTSVWEFISTDGGADMRRRAPDRLRSRSTRRCRARATRSPRRPTPVHRASCSRTCRWAAGGGQTRALLSIDHLYNGSVGLVDASTPLTVFAAGDSQSQFRRYDGSGAFNDAANWTAGDRHRLCRLPAPGRRADGLFLLAGTAPAGSRSGATMATTFCAGDRAWRPRRRRAGPPHPGCRGTPARRFPAGCGRGPAPRPRDLRRRRDWRSDTVLHPAGRSRSRSCGPRLRPTTSASPPGSRRLRPSAAGPRRGHRAPRARARPHGEPDAGVRPRAGERPAGGGGRTRGAGQGPQVRAAHGGPPGPRRVAARHAQGDREAHERPQPQGATQSGNFSRGVFQVLQSRKRSAKGLTELRLKGSASGRAGAARGPVAPGRGPHAGSAPARQREGPLPHPRAPLRGDRARHDLDRDRPLRRDADPGPARPGRACATSAASGRSSSAPASATSPARRVSSGPANSRRWCGRGPAWQRG